jgi:hypothetical protein
MRHLEQVLASAALAVSLHAVVFSVPVRERQASDLSAKPSESLAASSLGGVTVRTIAAWNATDASAHRGEVADTSVAAAAPVDATRYARGPERTDRELQLPSNVGNAAVSPPMGNLALRAPGAMGDEEFFPRDALDVGPFPTAPVLIDYPTTGAMTGTHAGILSLFIDEVGKVVRVRVDTQALAPAMQDAARSAFMDATFAPGMVDGLPVRSKIRVEVVFEAGARPR